MGKIVFLLFLVLLGLNSFAFDLVDNKEAKADIVISKDASEAEKYAAGELVKYAEKVSGVKLSVKTEAGNTGNVFIEVNKNLKGRYDTIGLFCNDGNLYLQGINERSVIYAVYEFLETYMGIRFFTDKIEKIPVSDKISCPDNLNYTYSNPFYSRETNHKGSTNNEFTVKCRFNGQIANGDPKYGGKIGFYKYFVHTFQNFLPASEYGTSHPEYYALINGNRKTTSDAQPCLSNPEVRKIIAENVIKLLDSYPTHDGIISVSQNDNKDVCECEKCQALNKKYGEHSGLLLEAVNYVADEVAKKYPDVMVETLAYHQTRLAPKGIKPRKNVIVRLCTIENNMAEPYENKDKYAPYKIANNTYLNYIGVDSNKVNSQFDENIKKWAKLTDKLFIWDYVINFQAYHNVQPNFQCLKPNMKYFIKNHVISMFSQGNRDNESSSFDELRTYILAKLLWNADVEVKPLIEEFCDGVYGEGSEEIKEIIRIFTDIVTKDHYYFCINTLDMEWMKNEDYIKCIKLYQSALEKTKNNETAYEKVYTSYLDWLYGWYKKSDKDFETIKVLCNLPWNTKNEFYNYLKDYSLSHNNPHWTEAVPFDRSRLARNYGKTGEPIEACKGLSADEWFEINDSQLGPMSQYKCYVDSDSSASDGKVLVLNPNQEWNSYIEIMGDVCKAQNEGYKSFDFYAVAKSRGKTSEPGNAFSLGIYDNDLKQHLYHYTAKLSELNNDSWSVVYMGSWNIENSLGASLFFVGEKNEFNVKEYVIDKLVIIKRK